MLDQLSDTKTQQNQKTLWIITDGKAGMDMPCLGVAQALGFRHTFKHITLSGPWRWMAPWGPVPPMQVPGRSKSLFNPPWPDMFLATGRMSIPFMQAVRKATNNRIFSVILQDPKTGAKSADLICLPEHDKLRGENVIATPTAPHIYSADKLNALRAHPNPKLQALPSPRIAIILGGPNAVYKFSPASLQRLTNSLRSLKKIGASFMITPSRRTPDELVKTVDEATKDAPRMLWNKEGENPYSHMLAMADHLIVTADSVNMTSEVCATARPVYTFTPEGGSKKFRQFHKRLRDFGATKELPEHFEKLENWTYDAAKLDAAKIIAAEIKKRCADLR